MRWRTLLIGEMNSRADVTWSSRCKSVDHMARNQRISLTVLTVLDNRISTTFSRTLPRKMRKPHMQKRYVCQARLFSSGIGSPAPNISLKAYGTPVTLRLYLWRTVQYHKFQDIYPLAPFFRIMVGVDNLLKAVSLAILYASTASASPFPGSVKYTTHHVREVGKGVRIETFHPPSTYEVRLTRLLHSSEGNAQPIS